VGVKLQVGVIVPVLDGVGLRLGVNSEVFVGVKVGVGDGVRVFVGVGVGDTVLLMDGVGVGVLDRLAVGV
jgi:hypothetical protein